MKKIVVAIDGPAGAGKSTIAKLAAEKLAEHVADFGAAAEVVSDVEAAVHRAKELADGYDVILFAGSLYLIGDVRRLWRNERGEER